MADQPSQKGKTGKLLGMPRTTGLIVIGLGALVAGYLVISHFSSSKSSGASSGKGGGHGGGPGWGSGQHAVVRVIREHHGHGHGGGKGSQ